MKNRGFDYRVEIGREGAGSSVLDYLSRRYLHSTRAEWSERLEGGEVLLDGTPVTAAATLRAGQSLVWRRPPWVEPQAPLRFDRLHEDEHLVAVSKPAGLPTLPGAGFLEHTLLHRLRSEIPGASVLHRLGRWTSGVVLCSKGAEAHAALSAAFRERRVEKLYRTLATGGPQEARFEIDTPIGEVPHPILGTVHAADPGGKPSRSRVEVVERRRGEFLADVRIETGRPHQIRIHLAAAGYPLAGDPLYVAGGRPPIDCRALPGDPGYLLHATRVALEHPVTREPFSVEAPLPVPLRVEGEAE